MIGLDGAANENYFQLQMRRLVVPLLVALAGCMAAPPPATQADAQRAHVAIDVLQRGREVLVAKCSGCHHTPLPTEHLAAEWPRRIDEMSGRAHLDDHQRQLLAAYLVALAPQSR